MVEMPHLPQSYRQNQKEDRRPHMRRVLVHELRTIHLEGTSVLFESYNLPAVLELQFYLSIWSAIRLRSVPVKKAKQPRQRTVMAASRKRNATRATSAKIVNLLGVVEPLINLTMYMVNVCKHCIHINVTPDSKCDNCSPPYG